MPADRSDPALLVPRVTAGPAVGESRTVVRLRQLRAIVGIELDKTLFSKRAIPTYLLSLLPVILLTIIGVLRDDRGQPYIDNIGAAREFYAFVYSGFVLGAVVFLGSAATFTSLFRAEILNGSLHFYLLAPVRRELLAIGKYLAGLIAACCLFGGATVVTYLLLYLPYGIDQLIADMTAGPALSQLLNYLGVTILGCVGYGAVFLLMGVLFRNPIIPVVALLGLEIMHFILPPALKALSVAHYLKGLLPITLSEGPLAVIVDPPSVMVSVLSLATLSAVALAAAIHYLKRVEVRYADD